MPAATRFLSFRSSSLTPQASRLPSMSTAYPHRFRSGRPCPAPRRPDELTPNPLPLPLHLLSFAWRPRRGLQPFGHPHRTSRLDSLDLSFVLSHRRGYSPPRSDEKRATFGRNSLRKSPTYGPSRPVSACSVPGSPWRAFGSGRLTPPQRGPSSTSHFSRTLPQAPGRAFSLPVATALSGPSGGGCGGCPHTPRARRHAPGAFGRGAIPSNLLLSAPTAREQPYDAQRHQGHRRRLGLDDQILSGSTPQALQSRRHWTYTCEAVKH